MTLRRQIGLRFSAVVAPILLGATLLGGIQQQDRRDALIAEQVILQVTRDRSTCEANPETYGGGTDGLGAARFLYTDRFTSQNPSAPVFPDALRTAIESGRPLAGVRAGSFSWLAVNMPWNAGPCRHALLRIPAGPRVSWFFAVRNASFFVALIVACGLVIIGPLVRRIQRLTSAVRDSAAAGFQVRLQAAGDDELAALGKAFNHAVDLLGGKAREIEARDQALTSYVARTSHDLLTPLTVLLGNLGELEQSVPATDASAQKLLALALEDAHYIAALVENLGLRARPTGAAPVRRDHTFDLREVVRRVVTRQGFIARRRSIELAMATPPEEVLILADSTLLERAIDNVVDNAIRYNREHGHVAVVLDVDRRGKLVLSVADDGPGVSPDVFKRHLEGERPPPSVPGASHRGLGLGLAIVRDVVALHGMTIDVEHPDTGGLRVLFRGHIESCAPSARRKNEEPNPSHPTLDP